MSQRFTKASQTHRTARGIRLFGNLKVMSAAALLCALSIVLGKYLAFNITGNIRLSLENLPILMAGIFFGPFIGGAVGISADLIGCMAAGYTPLPCVMIGGALVGIIAGSIAWYVSPRVTSRIGFIRVFLSVFPAHAIGSVLVKSIDLARYAKIPYPVTAGWRALTYLAIGLIEGVVISLLAKNKLFMGELTKLMYKKGTTRQ